LRRRRKGCDGMSGLTIKGKMTSAATFLRYGDYIINRDLIVSIVMNKTYGAQIYTTGRKEPYAVPNEVAEAWFSDIFDYGKVKLGGELK